MNRELKFRVWDLRLNMFLPIKDDGNFNPLWFHHRKDEYIVQQYVGLKDKNGKEIYEGDIVITDFSDKPMKIIFDFRTMGYKIGSYHHFLHEKYIKVVGNIFENTELI